jgi:hypothetical protein
MSTGTLSMGAYPAAMGVVVSIAVLARVTIAGDAALSYLSPFHPEQCGRAIAVSQRRLSESNNDRHARFTLAEGFLCCGLQDNPRALEAAIRMLSEVCREEPGSFFAQLEYADALRKQFPLSVEGERALRRAFDLLHEVDVGNARSELAGYIARNLKAHQAQREAAEPILREYAQAFRAGTLSAADVAGYVSLLAQTGPAGRDEARRHLDAFVAAHPTPALDTLYRAELARHRTPNVALRALYLDAEEHLCPGDGTPHDWQCALVKQRLATRREEACDAD